MGLHPILTHSLLQDDTMVGFQIGLPIFGDIAIGVWFGDHKAELDTPAFAYVCHTAFLDVRAKNN